MLVVEAINERAAAFYQGTGSVRLPDSFSGAAHAHDHLATACEVTAELHIAVMLGIVERTLDRGGSPCSQTPGRLGGT